MNICPICSGKAVYTYCSRQCSAKSRIIKKFCSNCGELLKKIIIRLAVHQSVGAIKGIKIL
jgi:hypothetical protein